MNIIHVNDKPWNYTVIPQAVSQNDDLIHNLQTIHLLDGTVHIQEVRLPNQIFLRGGICHKYGVKYQVKVDEIKCPTCGTLPKNIRR
tara:strand:+ start:402 stop:662 length:261 start_codon:yes stop_codon:yes gene_type:complete